MKLIKTYKLIKDIRYVTKLKILTNVKDILLFRLRVSQIRPTRGHMSTVYRHDPNISLWDSRLRYRKKHCLCNDLRPPVIPLFLRDWEYLYLLSLYSFVKRRNQVFMTT